jgi:hypothetical protein
MCPSFPDLREVVEFFFWFLRWLTAFVLDWFFWKRGGYLRAAGFGSLKDIVIRGFGCCATYCSPTGKKKPLDI